MKTVIHISADYPDPLVPSKTRAVANLLAATPGFRHHVYSLNRVAWYRRLSSSIVSERHTAIAYGAPPLGIGLTQFLAPVAHAIERDIRRRGLKPDLIHAHKFSVEGLVAATLAPKLQCPFICSLWGDTDTKIFEGKPGLRRRYREIAGQAALFLPAAPWTGEYFEKALKLKDGQVELLPVMTAGDDIIPPMQIDSPRLASVFALDSWHRKGFDVLTKAVALVARDIPGIAVDIYGEGSARSKEAMRRLIEQSCTKNRMHLKGALPHERVQRVLNGYTGFVMAPRRETYGMVHVEAVLGGVPILWAKDRGVDGLFPKSAVIGYRAEPESPEDVAAGIRFLANHQHSLKAAIGRLQKNGCFEYLQSAGIAARYRELLARAAMSAAS